MHQSGGWRKHERSSPRLTGILRAMQSVFKFFPIYKERPWGGQAIAQLGTHRSLPAGRKIGESWEISDRPDDESIIENGPFRGRSIRWLLDQHGSFIMGLPWKAGRRFPLLIKVLDAAERLSLQVHPPPRIARELKGQPKMEMWYFLGAEPRAAVLAGLKKGVRREDFERHLRAQTLEPLIHRIPVSPGDAMVIPSGRIHAIDAGCLILEIQQNSDTTYRIYDWNRVEPDGKPRQLHIEQTLKSMNFHDFEPRLVKRPSKSGVRDLADFRHFHTQSWSLDQERPLPTETVVILHMAEGQMEIVSEAGEKCRLNRGETALLAALPHQVRPVDNKVEVIVTWRDPL